MEYINQLKKEHTTIADMLEEVNSLLPYISNQETQLKLHHQMMEIIDYILLHLINEEEMIYPHFLRSPDVVIRAKADLFITELQELKSYFKGLKTNFLTLDQFNKDLELTSKLLREFTREITLRINKEEQDLFEIALNM